MVDLVIHGWFGGRMRKAIVPSLLILTVLSTSFAEPKLDALDEIIAKIKIAIQQLTDKGPVIKKQIEVTEATMNKYQSKAADPNLSIKERLYFEKSAENLRGKLNDFYNQVLAMSMAKKRMEGQIKLVEEDKEYIKNLIYLKEYKDLFDRIEKLDASHIKETPREYRQKATDPSRSPKQRARYETLADDYETFLIRVDNWSKLLETRLKRIEANKKD